MNTWHLTPTLARSFAAIGLAATVAIAQPAIAGTNPVVAHVNYADLALTTPEGQKTLQTRLNEAARQVCRFDSQGRLKTSRQENACYRETRQKVSVQMASVIRDNLLGG